ncbi:hypothetical protein LINGRAHAP2_LOCUS10037 [Linum grandiflorum]
MSFPDTHFLYTNDHARSPYHHALYLKHFATRPILTRLRVNVSDFDKKKFKTSSYIFNLGWNTLLYNRPHMFFPDAVAQFYANIKLEGSSLSAGNFTTIVNGYVIFVSQSLLARFLQLPTAGFSVFSNVNFSQLNFYPEDTLKQMTRGLGQPLVSALPHNLQILHYFITRVFLPRSEQRYMITELDTWIMYNATKGKPLDFSALMFSTMVKFGDHGLTGALLFAHEISVLLLQLGIPLHGRLLSVSPFDVISENGVYAVLGLPRSVNVSGE